MVITSYYNKDKEILIIFTNRHFKTMSSEENVEENVFIKNENNEIIGINIFNYKNNSLSSGLIDNENIIDIISKYFTDKEIEDPFLVGEIIEIKKHPKSSKLSVCQVKLSDEVRQIVCGAKNVGKNEKVIVANIGAIMPTGMVIRPSKLINVDSDGMLCSYKELGIEKSEEIGIALLDSSFITGRKFVAEV